MKLDGSQYNDRYLYRVYRSNQRESGWVLIYSTADTGDSYLWEDTGANANTGIRYYRITAVDTSGNESDPSAVVETSSDRKVYVYDTDQKASMEIPSSQTHHLYAETGRYGADLIVSAEKLSAEDTNTLGVYYFKAINSADGQVITSFVFDESAIKISLSYETTGGYISGAHPAISIAEADRQLSLYWFNGLEWMKLGGSVDVINNKVSMYAKSLGRYALRVSYRSDSFEIISVQPDKIFTPKSVYTRFIEFKYDNPKEAMVAGKIYDLRGAFVADMTDVGAGNLGSESGSLMWDGKYSDGSYASGGIYIYQIEVSGTEDKIINGTVVVAR
jgi:hypothetical protein